MSKPDQLVMVAEIKGGDPIRKGDAWAAYVDITDVQGKLIRLAASEADLTKLEIAFADLQAMVAKHKREAGTNVGVQEVTAIKVVDLKAHADFAQGTLVLQLVHENSRSTHVALTAQQTEELVRRIDAAKSDLAAHQKPN